MTEPYSVEDADPPRAYTVAEVRAKVLDHIAGMVKYWDELPAVDVATGRAQNQRDRLEGLAFSILSMLDGSTMGLPGFVIAPDPHPEDKPFRIEEGGNYFAEVPEGVDLCDIGGGLHEQIHKHFKRFPPKVNEHKRTEDVAGGPSGSGPVTR